MQGSQTSREGDDHSQEGNGKSLQTSGRNGVQGGRKEECEQRNYHAEDSKQARQNARKSSGEGLHTTDSQPIQRADLRQRRNLHPNGRMQSG